MRDRYRLYGWELSYFTGKVRSYLDYKQIDYDEQPIDFVHLTLQAKRRTGAAAMPIVVTPEGEWIQDSSVILDRLEARFPLRSVIPATPVQRFIAYLLELWGDEFWIPSAMHTRWSYPENYALFEREAGAALLPYLPRTLQDKAAAYAAEQMRNHLEAVGIVPTQLERLERWTRDMLDRLEDHFRVHTYLLGGRPTLADFALMGPLYGHLGRDPWPKRELIAKRPHVRAYIDRMAAPPIRTGELVPDDRLPETLLPIVEAASREMLPWVEGTLAELSKYLTDTGAGDRVPRGLGMIDVPLGGGTYRRAALPYVLWMVQRMLDVERALNPSGHTAVQRTMRELGAARWLDLDVPRLERVGLRVRAASSARGAA
jgi:glutathione S-transferase